MGGNNKRSKNNPNTFVRDFCCNFFVEVLPCLIQSHTKNAEVLNLNLNIFDEVLSKCLEYDSIQRFARSKALIFLRNIGVRKQFTVSK